MRLVLTLRNVVFLAGLWLLSAGSAVYGQSFDTPGAFNPIVPGYFADPTIKKFGDLYFLYSTTDGNGGGRAPAQVWVSADFHNWTLVPMNCLPQVRTTGT